MGIEGQWNLWCLCFLSSYCKLLWEIVLHFRHRTPIHFSPEVPVQPGFCRCSFGTGHFIRSACAWDYNYHGSYLSEKENIPKRLHLSVADLIQRCDSGGNCYFSGGIFVQRTKRGPGLIFRHAADGVFKEIKEAYLCIPFLCPCILCGDGNKRDSASGRFGFICNWHALQMVPAQKATVIIGKRYFPCWDSNCSLWRDRYYNSQIQGVFDFSESLRLTSASSGRTHHVLLCWLEMASRHDQRNREGRCAV